MPPLTLYAPAKLNLFLHMLARRADGYHEIESLVAFTELADELTIEPAPTLSLEVRGEFASDAGGGMHNLVLKAAAMLQTHSYNTLQGAQITLTKHIPVGAGLGGGSADAAAALRGLNQFWGLGFDTATLQRIASTLGADVAMCIESVPTIARGVGEVLAPLTKPLPKIYVVLVHPRVPLLTKDVYAALEMPTSIAPWVETVVTPNDFFASLAPTRNHLQRAAISISPVVAELLLALETLQPAANFVRMTGSGACCYALFEDAEHARKSAETIRQQQPEWWVQSTELRTS